MSNLKAGTISNGQVADIKNISMEEEEKVYENITLEQIDSIPEGYVDGFLLYVRAIENDVKKLKEELNEAKTELAELLTKLS